MSTEHIPINERIIFALDVADPRQAIELVDGLESHIKFFKVGLQLFFAGGWSVVDHIVGRGNKVMLDLKLYDIPATVTLAVKQFADRGISLTTVHGFTPVVEAALAASTDINILAVTVLTSMGQEHLKEQGVSGTVEELVTKRAKAVIQCGCHGIVCSAQEARPLRNQLGNDFLMVTPGIRPTGAAAGDQQRIATPGQAIGDGSDYLVIGRPIRDAVNRAQVITAIQQEIEAALSSP
ncbi:MAG: orotidine-5'-phosphate decarboxylase [Desulfobulbus propionicus]|nr:MAG: orotidine-5'-phosphate decarboxylase [Desulfobulbus propionicus]